VPKSINLKVALKLKQTTNKEQTMDFILNKSTSYDDEILPSSRGLLTIMLPPEELKAVQDEIKKLKEEVEELKSNLDYDPEESEIVSKDFIKRVEQKNNDLLSFIGGNFDYEDKVKEQIKDFYCDEFIKGNEDRWDEVGLDFEEEDEVKEKLKKGIIVVCN